MEIVGRGGRTLARGVVAGRRAPTSAFSVPGFPNMFLIYGPNTNGGTGSVIYVIEAGVAHVIAALGALAATGSRRDRGRAATSPSSSTASCARHWRAPSGTPAATSWYIDENGNDPNQWPWLWSTYRRRTAKIDPPAYRLAPGPAELSAAGR